MVDKNDIDNFDDLLTNASSSRANQISKLSRRYLRERRSCQAEFEIITQFVEKKLPI